MYLYLFTCYFMKISLQSLEQILDHISTIFMSYIQHFVDKLTHVILIHIALH